MFAPIYEEGAGYEIMDYLPVDADKTNTLFVSELPKTQNKDYKYVSYNDTYYIWQVVRNEDSFISFFGPETNTFFEPYLETINPNIIKDNRSNFHLGITNRLYFFVSNNGRYFNLDKLPTCTIEGVTYPVKKGGEGIYYVEVKYNVNSFEPDTILYDIWSDLILDGEVLEDVEMEFQVKPITNKVKLGKYNKQSTVGIPTLYGINDSENIKIGDIREVKVDFIEEYSRGKKIIPTNAEYRVYVKEGNREINIFPMQELELFDTEHTFLLNTNELVPNKYYVDIKVTQGRDVRYYDKVLKFNVVDNVTKYNI
jgi:hypothetical protein